MAKPCTALPQWLGKGLILVLSLSAIVACSATPKQDPGYDRPASHAAEQQTLKKSRQDVILAAERMLGKPYRYGGESPDRGFDCSGLVQYSHDKAGISVPRSSRAQLAASRPIALSNLKPGDLLFFRIDGKPSHVGIYLGGGEFIHAPSSGKRVSKAHLDNPYWKKRLIRAGNYY